MDTIPFIQQGDSNDTNTRKNYLRTLEENTRSWLEADARYFLHQSLSTPVMNVLCKAEGAYIYDLEGRKYLDLHGNGVHNVGFNNPAVVQAVQRQMEEALSFSPRRYTNIPAVKFAQKLVEMAPEGLDRVLFCPGGSEAIEMAILLAKLVTGKWKTISFWDNYHGTTWQAATVGGTEHFATGFGPMVPGAFHVEFPNYYRNPWGLKDKEQIDELHIRQIQVILERHPDVAAIIGTTITSTPVVPTQYFWQRVRDLCNQYGAFLIFDEVICGLGRTGKLFACEHYITPDVVVLGKSLGGGVVPLAGIMTLDKYNVIQNKSIGHFTHEKNPISCAAGLAVLEYLEENRLVENAAGLGDYLLERLEELKDRHPLIGHVEGKGLLIAIDLVKDRGTRERARQEAEQVMYFCMEKGLSFKIIDGNVLALSPSLTIGRDEADFIIDTLDQALNQIP